MGAIRNCKAAVELGASRHSGRVGVEQKPRPTPLGTVEVEEEAVDVEEEETVEEVEEETVDRQRWKLSPAPCGRR
eukprot:3712107-Pyramimonas_sp.AAC.1